MRETDKIPASRNLLARLHRAHTFCRKYGAGEFINRRILDRITRFLWQTKIFWTPRRLCTGLDSIRIDRPIFWAGLQGGGATILSRMLRRHPDVVNACGNCHFWAGPDEMQVLPKFKTLPEMWTLRSPGYGNMLGTEENHPVFGLERSWIYATDELLGRYRADESDWSKEIQEALTDAIKMCIRAYAVTAQPRFSDKSQSYALKIPLLRTCLPGVQFIVVLRNPYAICWRQATKNPDTKFRWWSRKPGQKEIFSLCVQHYRNTFNTVLEDLDSENDSVAIRYEDAVTNPEENMRKICNFCELEFMPHMLPAPDQSIPLGSTDRSKWYPIRTDINSQYLSEIPGWACDEVEKECGHIAERFGYERPR